MKTSFFRATLAVALSIISTLGFCTEAKISGSMNHTVFIDNGNVYGIGLNNFRQAFPETTTVAEVNPWVSSEHIRTAVYLGIQNIRSVAANGNRSLALTNDGQMLLWGQLTSTAWTKPYNPITVPGVVTDIALSGTAMYFITDGQVYTWAFTGEVTQVSNSGHGAIKSIAAGDKHLVALYADGTIGTLGINTNGQLGFGTSATVATTLTKVVGISGAVEITANGSSSAVRATTGEILVFGKNIKGQLGLQNNIDVFAPVVVPGVTGVKKMTMNYAATFLLMNDNTVKASGFHNFIAGMIYNSNKVFETLPGITGTVSLEASGQQIFVDMSNAVGTLRGWGGNAHGQLGDNTIVERHNPSYAYFTPMPAYVAPVTVGAVSTGTCGSIYSNPFGNAVASNKNGSTCKDKGNHGTKGKG
jgi:alpha-tubulin suppressor-like RCC1 family protein